MFQLEASKLLRQESYSPPSRIASGRKPVCIYIYECINCTQEVRVRAGYLSKASGLCVACSNRKSHPKALKARRLRPFESRLKRLRSIDPNCNLNYEDYLELTTIHICHYCKSSIEWKPYGSASTHWLDRKDNRLPHLKSNVVVCCGSCNRTKGDRFTYLEFMKISQVLQEILEARQHAQL